jgi:molybdate transport system regulatory protein
MNSVIQPRLRVMHGKTIALGPGKADVLAAIARTGSLSQAARDLGMSYRRLWLLVDTMNQCFLLPLVETQTGGAQGGGTALTETGIQVLQHYRAIDAQTRQAIAAESVQLMALLKPLDPPTMLTTDITTDQSESV